MPHYSIVRVLLGMSSSPSARGAPGWGRGVCSYFLRVAVVHVRVWVPYVGYAGS